MRSRYSAYVFKLSDYLRETWHSSTRPLELNVEDDDIAWQRLQLIASGEDWVETALVDMDGKHSFTFRFRPAEITHVGVWMNYGGWSGSGSENYYNLGLEPCIGGRDSLSSAKLLGEYTVLPAQGSRSWRLELSIR